MNKNKDIICWWSGGITSAVACKLAIELYGHERCRVIMLDTKNEHEDTYRFLKDCSKWYQLPIEMLSEIPESYQNIQDTWFKHLSLNTANGAICSYKLKRRAREKWEKHNFYTHQVFGFEFNKNEFKRAMAMNLNNKQAKPIFPLLMFGHDKEDCIKMVTDAGIKIPEAYRLGFHNNNCLKTGCVQGGIGYWKKMQKEMPDKFNNMANIEHQITNRKGQPVTMLKCQSKESKEKARIKKYSDLVFLRAHPDYPENKTIDDMEGREVKPLTDCNGFCGIDDLLERSPTEREINNYQELEK